MFAEPYDTELQGIAEIAGICDINPARATEMGRLCGQAPTFSDFDEMIRETQPDTIIVTTPDHLHDEFIIRALEAGCDVVSEKPMTTDVPAYRFVRILLRY